MLHAMDVHDVLEMPIQIGQDAWSDAWWLAIDSIENIQQHGNILLFQKGRKFIAKIFLKL